MNRTTMDREHHDNIPRQMGQGSEFQSEIQVGASSDTEHRRPANILIIDDDIDSALQVDSVFSHLGCQTNCALNNHEARKMLCALKPDVIILDWMLDHHVNAADIVRQCTKTFARFDGESRVRANRRPMIITYSSLNESDISVLETPYFKHFDHWQKPIRQRDLLERALGLLEVVGR